MPTSKAISASSFFGKDRYEYYLNELLTEQTIGGQKLSKDQLKEGFSKRKNKISFEKFVDKLVTTKAAKAVVSSPGKGPSPAASGGMNGPRGNALVRSPSGALQKYTGVSQKVGGGIEEDISAIAKYMSSIADTLALQKKVDNDASAYDKRKAEQEKRKLTENKLEKRFEGLKKAAEKIIAPVKSLLDKILQFFTTVILGRIVYRLVEWLGDEKNASKVKSIIRFVKDWWPALLGSYILFGTSFGKLVRGLTGTVGRFIFQIGKVAIPQLLKVIAANPLTSLVVGGAAAAGVGAYAASQQNEQKREGVKPGQGTPGSTQLQREQVLQRGLGGMFNGGGFVNGFVSGEKGVDKVPAMLSDGEFVMSRGAVAKYGVDTLEAMNAAGGGTNKPKIMSGTTYASGGGMIGKSRSGDDIEYYIDEIIKGLAPQYKWANGLAKRAGISVQSVINQTAKNAINQASSAASSAYTGFMDKGADLHGHLTRGGIKNDMLNLGNKALNALQNNFNTVKEVAKNASISASKLGTSEKYKAMANNNEKKSQEAISKYDAWVQSLPKGFLKDTMNRGLIPIPTGNAFGMTGLTYIKAMMGPLGRPFKILSNESVDKARQEMIDRTASANGLRVGADGKMSMEWNRVSGPGSGQYTDDLKSLGGASGFGGGKFFNSTFGRWSGTQKGDKIVTNDVYNFNEPVGVYAKKSMDAIKKGDFGQGFYNIMSMAGKFAQDIGWMNQRALGSEIEVGSVKNIDPKTGKPKPKATSSPVTLYKPNDPRKKNTGESYKSRFARPKNAGVKSVKPPSKPSVIYRYPQSVNKNKPSSIYNRPSTSNVPNFSASTRGSRSKQNTLGLAR